MQMVRWKLPNWFRFLSVFIFTTHIWSFRHERARILMHKYHVSSEKISTGKVRRSNDITNTCFWNRYAIVLFLDCSLWTVMRAFFDWRNIWRKTWTIENYYSKKIVGDGPYEIFSARNFSRWVGWGQFFHGLTSFGLRSVRYRRKGIREKRQYSCKVKSIGTESKKTHSLLFFWNI